MSELSREKKSVSKSVAAESTFSDWMVVRQLERVSVSVSGTFSGTVTLQRRLDGSNARDVFQTAAGTEQSYYADETCELRIGIKTGDYTSGTAACRLGKG